ncbi:hypothetical protein VTN02DRAFT_4071 [Thermoascus thermophilus]
MRWYRHLQRKLRTILPIPPKLDYRSCDEIGKNLLPFWFQTTQSIGLKISQSVLLNIFFVGTLKLTMLSVSLDFILELVIGECITARRWKRDSLTS